MTSRQIWASSWEWPTLAVAATVYGGWLAVTWWHGALPGWLLPILGGWLVAWHSSLQHELIHDHPGGRRAVAAVLGYPPLALWLPFQIYRQTHRTHHNDGRLTDPYDDPESFFFPAEEWARLHPARRALHWVNHTLPGRLVAGPAIAVAAFLAREVRLRRHRRAWLGHLPGVVAVLGWTVGVCHMSAGEYLLCFVYPGTSLMLLRSYYEHRWAEAPEARTAIVESRGLLALLFLNNNLHAAHHLDPTMPWYRLPAFYRANRTTILARNQGFLVPGYVALLRRFAWRPNYLPAHPTVTGPDARLATRQVG